MLTLDRENPKLLLGSDDNISDDYIEKMLEFAKNAGTDEAWVALPSDFLNITSSKYCFKSVLPVSFMHVAGIGRGIGWMIHDKEGAPLLSYEFTYASDYEYLLRAMKKGYRFSEVYCTYTHTKGGRSSRNWLKGLQEEYKIGRRYRDGKWKHLLTTCSLLYLTLKGIVRVSAMSRMLINKTF